MVQVYARPSKRQIVPRSCTVHNTEFRCLRGILNASLDRRPRVRFRVSRLINRANVNRKKFEVTPADISQGRLQIARLDANQEEKRITRAQTNRGLCATQRNRARSS